MAGTSTFCNLCNLMLNSQEQFVAHQAGKAHKRKVAAGPSAATPTSSATVTKIGTQAFCNVCNLMLNSYVQLVAHQAGKAHKRKVAAGPSSATSTSSQTVMKIVRAKPFIRFVSSQEGPASVQNKTEGTVSETGQADSSCPDGSATFKNNELYCSICVVKLTSQAMADIHYAGAKHRRAVSLSSGGSGGGDAGEGNKRKFEEVCEVCNVPLVSKVVAEAHYAGAKHEKRLKWSQNINAADPCPLFSGSALRPACVDASGGQERTKTQPGLFYCHFCKVTLNSKVQLDAHYQGSKHKNTVNKVPPQRKKPYTFRPPQEKPYAPRPPPQEEQYVSPSHHYPAGNFGNPNGFGNSNNFGNSSAPIPFRPMPPSLLYPQY